MPGFDAEIRWGFDERSDLGVRIPSMSGVVVNYKRRLDGPTVQDSWATAVMMGAGFVNMGQHAIAEASLITSGRGRQATPYGGLQVMQVVPLSRSALSDSPTAGGFLGVPPGDATLGVSLELGVFYDEPAMKTRQHNVLVVPSIVLHGNPLGNILRPWGSHPRHATKARPRL